MKIIKNIIKFIMILISMVLYIVLAFTGNTMYFIAFTIIIALLIVWNTYKKIKGLNDLNTKISKIVRYIRVTFNLISLAIILTLSYFIITYEGDILTDFWEMGLLVETQKDDYYDKMNEKDYDDFRIIYNRDMEATLPLIEKYIDEISKKNNTLLGINSSDKLTIQIDYDEEVFLMRAMLFAGNNNDNIGGYYHKKSNTIYLYVKNPVNDVLMNIPQINMSEGSFSINDNTFKDILFHEYTHYAIDMFMDKNNMDENSLPLWFEEGICEYRTESEIYFDEELKYISFKNLNTYKDFNNELNNLQANIYGQSKLAVLKIVNEKGENVLKDMILSFKEKDFETIIQEYMNCPFENFEKDLELDIKNGKFETIVEENKVDEYRDITTKCLEDYIRYDENNIRAYEALGYIYEGNEENTKLINLFKDAIKKNPKEYMLYHKLGLAYEYVGENTLAKENFDKAKLLKNEDD